MTVIYTDELDILCILYLIKTSGLSALSYFLHWKCFGTSLSGMASFLFVVADFLLFSETEATLAEASKTICQSDIPGQPPSRSALGLVTIQNMNQSMVLPCSFAALQGGRSLHVIQNSKTKCLNYSPAEM